jgi:hypothetical protein
LSHDEHHGQEWEASAGWKRCRSSETEAVQPEQEEELAEISEH